MKMKTHRGAAKRFKKTGGGGYKRKRAFLRHGMRKRNQDTKRVLRKKAMVSANEKLKVKQHPIEKFADLTFNPNSGTQLKNWGFVHLAGILILSYRSVLRDSMHFHRFE